MEHRAYFVQKSENGGRRWDEAQFRGQDQIGAQLLGGGAADVVIAALVLGTGPEESLGDTAGDRHCRALHLANEAELLLPRELTAHLIDLCRQFDRLLPYPQILDFLSPHTKEWPKGLKSRHEIA